MLQPGSPSPLTRLEQGLLLAVLAFYAMGLPLQYLLLQPGFVGYDEQGVLDQVQSWLEGGHLNYSFGQAGPLLLGLGWLTRLAGPSLSLLHLPYLMAALAQGPLLYLWLRKRVGERAALWSALAILVNAMTFTQGRSLLAPELCPSLFIGLLWAADACESGAQAFLWGAATASLLFLYEGWALAGLALLPYAAAQWPRRRSAWAALGGALVLLALAWLSYGDWQAYLQTRWAHTAGASPLARQAWDNLIGLPLPGHRLPFSAVPGLPLPPLWTWPLVALGLPLAWRSQRWLGWVALTAAPALASAGTAQEPHRLFPLWVALAVVGGLGAARLWRSRRGWGPAACVGLLILGMSVEAWGWWRVPAANAGLSYGLSRNLQECARYLAAEAPPEGWELIDGLGSTPDESFRFLLDEAGAPRRAGGRPVALVPWDDRPGLDGLAGLIQPVSSGGIRPIYLFFPTPASAARLRSVARLLAPLHQAQLHQRPVTLRALARQALQDPACRDPWARTVLWEAWLDASRAAGLWDAAAARPGLDEGLFNGRCYDLAAEMARPSDPAWADALAQRALRADGRRRDLPPLLRADTF
jgi:hypothetical protein